MPNRPRLLVAEDDENDIALLNLALQRAGVRAHVRFVRDGQEALDYLEGVPPFSNRDHYPFPTLLLLDLKMPRLNGFDVLRWLRQHPELNRLTVIILSASDLPSDVNLAYDLGANSYALKPNNPQKLTDLALSLERYWFEHHCFANCPSLPQRANKEA